MSAQRHKNDELKYRRTDRQKPQLKLKLENQNGIKYNKLSRGEICVANFIPLANSASQGNY